ncbi:hypothetical protein JNB_02200 [Janibacter sp. HTCC2649]|uniref:hypothetical protein n=1 Tax=Janibacter sp. HTCC2649 TaxID=313589 RepID=UPI000066EA8B|nr:hypothetical protein [Janibacter sp. HTCC2649]EAP98942.1 hypothetical protein JNB_02200 [Janibacter sp. HTCC2649]
MSSPENPWAGQGSVLLDIGGSVGALIVTMPPETEGLEVEIRSVDGHHHHGDDGSHDHGHHHHHPHVAVVARPGPSQPVHTLVYPSLEEGRYDLVPIPGDRVALTATARGGEVTWVDWPTAG